MRKTIYQWHHMPGDMILNPWLDCPLSIHSTDFGILEDVNLAVTDSTNDIVSRHFNIQIEDLEDLEKIGTSFKGVTSCYAIQAGREVRVMVSSEIVSDDQSHVMAKDIARKIENEMTYPGQIRVNVIRETRATDYAK